MNNGYTLLKTVYLRKFIDYRVFNQLKDYLISNQVIETDGKYILHEKSYGYKLIGKYAIGTRFVSIDGLMNDKLEDNKSEVKLSSVHYHLYHNLLNRVNYDFNTFEYEMNELDRLDEIRYFMFNYKDNEDFMFTIDSFGRRLHTPFTCVSSKSRKHINWKNTEDNTVIEIDIVNSQLVMLCSLLNSFFYNIQLYPSHILYPLRCSAYRVDRYKDSKYNDLDEFITLCEKGLIYERIMYEYNNKESVKLNRDEVKEMLFSQVLFCKSKNNKMTKIFKSMFPNVLDFIIDQKKDNYKDLSCQMQRIESKIVIWNVCGRLMREYVDVPVITVHDSIITNKSSEEVVKRLMIEEIMKYGITPTLKVKQYERNNYVGI